MQRDGAAGAPDEIAGVGGDDKARFLLRHGRYDSLFRGRSLN
jgi:hypothetical protein